MTKAGKAGPWVAQDDREFYLSCPGSR